MKRLKDVVENKNVLFEYKNKTGGVKNIIVITDSKLYMEGTTRNRFGSSTKGLRSVELSYVTGVFKGKINNIVLVIAGILLSSLGIIFSTTAGSTEVEMSMLGFLLAVTGALLIAIYFLLGSKFLTISTVNDTIVLPTKKLSDKQVDEIFDIIDNLIENNKDM